MPGEKTDKIKVAVRVRPSNRREIDLKTPIIIDMMNSQTILYQPNPNNPKNDDRSAMTNKTFAFDESFWSIDPADEKFAGQDRVFSRLGLDVMENAFKGYNGCIFAYGQTGSGKSYTMMGTTTQPGIIPRLCSRLFEEIAQRENKDVMYKVEVSYMEIYNEKVRDLLDVQGLAHNVNEQRKALRVREHNILGPYVDGLSQLIVTGLADIEKLMSEGNKSRTVAATNMNTESSRSHAVFNIILTETITDPGANVSGEKKSKLSLVDLAGSERAQKTGAVGERLREGCNINKSLTTLMLVISALADASAAAAAGAAGKENKNRSSKAVFVPYRDSTLTWLLKDNLGGNSKTVMIATLSPAGDNYEETLSTLRYADRAKRIVNHAVINEDPNAQIIRELREQVEGLKHELECAKEMQAPELKEKLEESENIIKELSKTWEEKLVETEKKHKERHEALEKMGISVQTSGIKVEKSRFYLVNLNADPSLNELLVYYLKTRTAVGRGENQDILLHGLGIHDEHCIFELDEDEVYLTPTGDAKTLLNGNRIAEKTKLSNNDHILWGMNHFFRINCPKRINPNENDIMNVSRDEFTRNGEFQRAQEEVMLAELQNDPIKKVIMDLEKHHTAEKEEALAQQKLEFERQLDKLKGQLSTNGNAAIAASSSGAAVPPVSGSVSTTMTTESSATSPMTSSNLMTMSQYSGSMMNLPPMTGSYAAALAAAAMVTSAHNQQSLTMGVDPVTGAAPGGMADTLWSSQSSTPAWMGSQSSVFATPHNIQLVQARYQAWVEQRELSLSQMLVRLRELLAKANSLIREANFLADEMAKATEYSVTLQIPAASLNPNGRKQGIISEPAILVKRDNRCSQIWSLEKLENKVVEMRELYEEWKDTSCPDRMPLGNPFNNAESPANGEEVVKEDPFFDAQEDHSLIGVANIYLSCLFQKIKFKYQIPIINQQGETSGKLAVELSVVSGELPDLVARDSSTMAASYNQNSVSMTSSVYSTAPVCNLTSSVSTNNQSGQQDPNNIMNSSADTLDDTSNPSRSASGYSLGTPVTVRVRVLQATHLPDSLSHFVFCQYRFWGQTQPTVVPPALQPDYVQHSGGGGASTGGGCTSSGTGSGPGTSTFKFAHSQDFCLLLSDDLLEHLAEDALSIEVFGNRSPGFSAAMQQCELSLGVQLGSLQYSVVDGGSSKIVSKEEEAASSMATARRFGDRWMELYRRLEYWVCIEELNEQGEYQKVELVPGPNTGSGSSGGGVNSVGGDAAVADVATGGVFQLRHGQTRRVRVFVRPNKVSRGCRGSLPLICDRIEEISVGDVICARKPVQSRRSSLVSNTCSLDSYQEDDLNRLRDAWSLAITRRQEYLNEQLQNVVNRDSKTQADEQREAALMQQWMRLTEERDAVLVPAPGSGIPGAPATWSPVVGMERHCPVIFLNVDSAEMNAAGPAAISDPGPVPCAIDTLGNVTVMAGGNCLLPSTDTGNSGNGGTDESQFLLLPFVKRYESLCGAVAQWDASLHEDIHLNRITPAGERIYITVKVVVRLSHPALVDLVLRKRICVNVYKKQGSLTSFFKKQWTRYMNEDNMRPIWSGVTYQIVSGIPQNFLDIEDRETLARLAANQGEGCVSSADQESYIEKYIRSVSAVESLLQVDRIRQEVACQEIVAQMRKQRRSLAHIGGTSQLADGASNSRRRPVIMGNPANPQGGPIQQLPMTMMMMMSAAQARQPHMKKYISVPDFQGMYRSSSLTNLSNGFAAQDTLNDKTSGSKLGERMDYETPKSGSICNLTKLSDPNILNGRGVGPATKDDPTFNSKVAIKSALIPKRPQPPRNLLMVGSKTPQSCMVPPRSGSGQEPHTQQLLAHSATEDSLTRSKSSGYGSSQTVASQRQQQLQQQLTTPTSGLNNNNGTTGSGLMQLSSVINNNNSGTRPVTVGARVWTVMGEKRVPGTVRFLDYTKFQPGLWVGLELDDEQGTSNGTVDGVSYFSCSPNHGVFARPDNVFIDY